ncbi:uncharacterized protein LOC117541256 isoform X2 [Gymnodraco acuticeps]|uniref:Uncharacterized protein LOC117541256 isoform X2 n=1 Tax=Gymnodraco acuticeps TaxID=8218 RepID=A0A6P8TJW4_GYMAC|nr:uncharacterized protein LOC117541256 isoform X2 [Gymnodraco acuticeps]
MSEFRRIVMSSFLMLLLHFPAADVKRYSRIVRVGDKVTLPCYNVTHDQEKCERTTWTFSDSRSSVTLFEYGKIHKEAKANSDRLRVKQKCSLVIKNVTEENAGRYDCQQYNKSQHKQVTEHQDNNEVTLRCSLMTRGNCTLAVKWLLQGQDVDKDHREIKTSQSSCSASVTFQTSPFSYTPRSKLFTCEVTDENTRKVHLFPFSPQSSGWWWWIIVVIVAVAALTIITVAVIRRKRTQGNETQTDNMANPEDGAFYASISYTRKSSRAHLHDDDEDAVTYSTVRAPSSSSAASADPSLLYATVNKPRKKPM